MNLINFPLSEENEYWMTAGDLLKAAQNGRATADYWSQFFFEALAITLILKSLFLSLGGPH